MSAPQPRRIDPIDAGAAVVVMALAVSLSLFAIRSNDVWWMLAVGRRIIESHAFIYTDPFSFPLGGVPWSPQSWLAAIVFFFTHAVAGAAGLVVLRAVLVVAITAVTLGTLGRTGVSWAASAGLVVLMLLVAHTRFLVRAHLFEYLFIAMLMGFLLTSHERRGRSFFVVPVVIQVLWTNMHPSFLLGPALVLLFFAGEWVSERHPSGFMRPLHRHDYRRAAILFGLLLVACVIDPNPVAFLSQPLGGEQRELISHFTLEWRSPFDPAIASGSFHPYYEVLLALALAALVVNARRLPLAALLMMAATAVLSLQSHRFRVEFVLVAVPLVAVLLSGASVSAAVRRRVGSQRARVALGVVALVLALGTGAARWEFAPGVKARFPDAALETAVEGGVANRPFNTIGFGSYMTWAVYDERQNFIDGRNYDPALYRDFLLAQSRREGMEQVMERYHLDAFIIPSLERSDAGMTNIHRWLAAQRGWSLVHLDDVAYLYVRDAEAPPAFLQVHAYRAYHPLTIANRRMSEEQLDAVTTDLERAVVESPGYARVWVDLAMARAAHGEHDRALEAVTRALAIDGHDKTALELRRRLTGDGR